MQDKTVAEAFKYNAAANEIDLAEAEKRLDATFDKRAKLADQSTFGLLALNGASAVATFSAMQVDSKILHLLDISATKLAFSLSAFLFGLILAVIGVWAETIHLTNTAAKQFVRANALRNIKKALSDDIRPDAVERLGETLKELPSVPPMDFAYSPAQLTLHNFAGGAWLGGMASAIWLVARNISWCG